MNIKSKIILISSGLFMSLAFMNCSARNAVDFSRVSAKSDETENGRPYDGKIFVLSGDICPDGTRIQARIRLETETSAELLRYECDEITPVALGAGDFQFDPSRPGELQYQNQTYSNSLVGTRIDMSLVSPEIGNCYMLIQDLGTLADESALPDQSPLQIYEDGKPLGPAHAVHADIRNTGLGLFSYWADSPDMKVLRFSASDNTNPMTNGRTYTWDIKP